MLVSQQVELSKRSKVSNRADVAYELSTLAQQEPNGNFLFLFPREHFYLTNNKPKDTTRIDRFLRNSIGQVPAIYSDSLSRRSAGVMADYLRYLGYFNASAYHEADRRSRQRVNLIYHVDAGRRYFIDTVEYSSPEPVIDSLLQIAKAESALQPGEPLDLNQFDREKSRISRFLRNQGYAYFSNGYFDKLEIDTSQRSGFANLYLQVLPPEREAAFKKYRIGSVTVLADYQPGETNGGSTIGIDTTINGVRFLTSLPYFRMRPELLVNNIFLTADSLYSREAYDKTNAALGALGIYRFVRINQIVDPNDENVLNYQIQLSPDKKMAIGVDLDLNYTDRNQSITAGNLIGISVSPNFRNRNVFGGAELLTTSLRAGVELNPRVNASDGAFFNTVDLGAEISLNLPRFRDFGLYSLLNSTNLINSGFYRQLQERATTRYSVAYEFLLLRDFYAYNTANGRLGFDFRKSTTTNYRINHLALDILNFTIEPNFDTILLTNERLRRSVADQYFVSLLFRNLEFTRVGRTDRRGRSITLNGLLEITGGEFYLAERLFGGVDGNTTFAQFALAVADMRFYKQYTPVTSFASRFLISVGRPFTERQVLPYVKQFFAGGANSMRAWAPRGLGPGGYVDTLSLENTFNSNLRLYQTGDLQLELNFEYRFNLFSFFRGAVFADIGNVWLLDQDRERPGAQFLLRKSIRTNSRGESYLHQPFYRQLAVAAGTGIRIDLSYFIFRLDAAIPLRFNYPQDGFGRPIFEDPMDRDERDFPESAYWRRFSIEEFELQDITFQLGLGYPF